MKKLLKVSKSALAAVLFLSLFSTFASAAAEGEQALWVGGAAGALVPTKSSTTARGAFGATVGAKIGTEFGFGGYYFTSPKDEGSTQGKFDLNFYGVEGTYHFEGEAKGAYFGIRLGITKIDSGTGSSAISVSPFHVGVVGGYNHWLTDSISLGGDVTVYSVSKGDATVSGGTVSVDSFSALSFLGTLKFWL
jgi:hypothetical protein